MLFMTYLLWGKSHQENIVIDFSHLSKFIRRIYIYIFMSYLLGANPICIRTPEHLLSAVSWPTPCMGPPDMLPVGVGAPGKGP